MAKAADFRQGRDQVAVAAATKLTVDNFTTLLIPKKGRDQVTVTRRRRFKDLLDALYALFYAPDLAETADSSRWRRDELTVPTFFQAVPARLTYRSTRSGIQGLIL